MFNVVDDVILFFSPASPSLLPFQGKQVPGTLHWKKKLCKRDGSGGRVFSGCPWCYLGNIRVYPYNRDLAIIFLPTEYAASFSCSHVNCIWLSSGYKRQRCVAGSNSLNPGTETTVTTRCLGRNLLCSCALKCSDFYFYLSGLMTCPTSLGGRYLLTLKCSFLSIIWLFHSFTVTTGCFKILSSMLRYVCFTMISTFNLTPSATGMTGRDGRKTPRFYRLV